MRAVVVLGVVAAVTSGTSDVVAAKNPAKASLGCRKVLGRTFRQLARLGFDEVDRCERRAAKGKTTRDCTALRLSETAYRRWAHRTESFVLARCATDDPVRRNFPLADLPGGGSTGNPGFGVEDVTVAIEASAAQVQQPMDAQARAVAGPSSCRTAVGDVRTTVSLRTMNAAVQCQRRLDRRAQVFGMLDPQCAVPPPDAVVREAAGRIADACGGTSGASVGSCDPLPGCVIDAAAATGLALARAAYGQCGNGVIDSGEDCDDGNTVADECTQCRSAACGNGRVEGNEECDDGNLLDHDTCTECRNPICGDGIVDVGAEECDDENTVAGDGCADCRLEAITCSEQGILATVTFEYDQSFGEVAGLRLRVRYPEILSIPGSLIAPTIAQRVTSLIGVGGSITVADLNVLPEGAPDAVDDTIQTIVAVPQGTTVPSGPFEAIRFDCVAGTPVVAGEFACQVVEAVDPFTNAKSPAEIARGTRCSVRVEVPPAQ